MIDNTPKGMREALCLAQAGLADRIRAGMDADRSRQAIEQITVLLRQIDEHRPVGPNGKHGQRHTDTCGCEDPPGHRNPWSLTLWPEQVEV